MKLCVIGSRGHAGQVFESLAGLPEVQLCAISPGCEDSPAALIQMARTAGFSPEIHTDWKRMIAELRPDCVVVDGPFELHAEMSCFALEHGCHVFCEKPIALNLADLERIKDAWRASRKHIRAMVGVQNDPPFRHALELVRAGRVGKVKMIRAQKSYRLGERPEFFRHHATYGGTIPWVGIHAFSWILAFSGCSETEYCQATQTTSDNHNYGDLEMACQCMMVMKNGVQAQVSIDYLRPAHAPTHGDDQLRVAGTSGVLEIRNGIVTLVDEAGEQVMPLTSREPKLFEEFIQNLKKRPEDFSGDAETFAVNRVCLEARDCAVLI